MLEDKNENDNLIPHLRVKNNKNLKFEKSSIDGKSQREERKNFQITLRTVILAQHLDS